jgi:hypothetical protein
MVLTLLPHRRKIESAASANRNISGVNKMTKVMLSDYGVVVNSDEIHGHAFLMEAVSKAELIRELSPAGIFYNRSEVLNVKLRTFLSGSAIGILQSIGVEIHSTEVNFDKLSGNEPEENEEEASANVYHAFYVESVISSTRLDDSRHPLMELPKYAKMYEKPKNQEILDKKIRIYSKSVELMGTTLMLEPLLEEDDEDDGLTSGRLTDNAKEAQFEAHRAQQSALRDRAVGVLDYLEEHFFANGEEVTVIPISEATEKYANIKIEVDGEELPMISYETLAHDLKQAIQPID